MDLEDGGAAVGSAVEPDGQRAAPLAPNRGGTSRKGRVVGTRKHWFLCSLLPLRRRDGPGRRCWCSSRIGRSSDVFRAWTRERVGPFLRGFGRCSDLLSVLGGQLDALEHGGK